MYDDDMYAELAAARQRADDAEAAMERMRAAAGGNLTQQSQDAQEQERIAAMDAVPLIVDGQYNADYARQIHNLRTGQDISQDAWYASGGGRL